MAAGKIQETKAYRMFHQSGENRPCNLKKHGRLVASMRKYGFIRSFPIVVIRDAEDRLVIKDGQHRLAVAESLGLPVFWTEEKTDFDVAEINSTAKVWLPKDYAMKHAANGLADYRDALEFSERFGTPVLISCALLSGTAFAKNIAGAFIGGTFKVKDRQWAESVGALYTGMSRLAPALKKVQFLQACMAVCRVQDFDSNRMMAGAERCREELVNYGTHEGFLNMLEKVYNFGRKTLVPLKIQAIQVMRERNPAKKNAK